MDKNYVKCINVNDAVRWSIMHIFIIWMHYILNYVFKNEHDILLPVFIETLHAQSLL